MCVQVHARSCPSTYLFVCLTLFIFLLSCIFAKAFTDSLPLLTPKKMPNSKKRQKGKGNKKTKKSSYYTFDS